MGIESNDLSNFYIFIVFLFTFLLCAFMTNLGLLIFLTFLMLQLLLCFIYFPSHPTPGNIMTLFLQ